jgi:maltose O-acetyltransferase
MRLYIISKMEGKTEYEKMTAGEIYNPIDPELCLMRNEAESLCNEYNNTTEQQIDIRQKIFDKLFGHWEEGCRIRAPFHCDFGKNIHLGKRVYMNFNCCILDCANVYIGDNTLLGPYVQVYSVTHPVDHETRNNYVMWGKEVRIGSNVWIGGGAIICPGVTIGDNSTIGAGSVVTKDIPANCVAVGNPCKVIKYLNKDN